MRPYLSGAAILAIAMGVGRFAYTPLLVVMRADAGLSVTAAGVLASANLAGYLIGALSGLIPAFKANRPAALRWGVLGVVLLTAAMALPPWAWLAARLLVGVCSGVVFVATVSLLHDHAARESARHGPGVLLSGVGLGIAAAGLLVPLFAPFGGSRAAWLGLGVVSAIVVALAVRGVPAEPPVHEPSGTATARGGGWELVGWLTFTYSVEGAAYIIPATFLVAMVSESAAIARFAPATWVIVGLVAAPSTVVWTWIARRIGLAPAFVLALVVQGATLLAPLVTPPAVGALLVALGLGGTFIGIVALVTALARRYQPYHFASVVAILTVCYGVGQIVGPLIATHIAIVTGSYQPSFTLAALTLFVAVALFIARLAVARLSA